MDFSLSTEQVALRDGVRRFCIEHYAFKQRQIVARDHHAFRRQNWDLFAELGWLGAALPEHAGGSGGSAVEFAIIAEEFGRAMVLEPYLADAVVPAQAILASTPNPACNRLLDSLVTGHLLFAFAHSEPDAGAGCTGVAMSARRSPNGSFRLNGRKTPVLGGTHADRLIVSARTDGTPGDRSGLSMFLVDPKHQGVLARSFRLLDGTDATELRFSDVDVPETALLGTEGTAVEAIEAAIAIMLLGLCAEAVGAMDDVITATSSYLKTRRAFGTTLITFQALQHRLAEMLIELELSRSIVHRTLAVFASTEDSAMRLAAASSAKALVGRSARFVGANGIQLHGGMGMVEDYLIGQHFKQLTVIDNLQGNSEYHWSQCA